MFLLFFALFSTIIILLLLQLDTIESPHIQEDIPIFILYIICSLLFFALSSHTTHKIVFNTHELYLDNSASFPKHIQYKNIQWIRSNLFFITIKGHNTQKFKIFALFYATQKRAKLLQSIAQYNSIYVY
jgi:hypothetical protein